MDAASPLKRGERGRELLLAAGFLAGAGLLAALAEPARVWDEPVAVLLVVLFAVAARVELDVGRGYTVPTQLVFVPMLLLLPTPWVPLLVAAGWLLAKLSEVVPGRVHPERTVVALGNSWFAVGPAAVLVALDADRAAWDLWPAYLLALAAQFAGDLAAAAVREGAAVARELIRGVYVIDVLLSGPALLAAVASARDDRFAFLAVVPGVALFVLFGRERAHRLADALSLAERSEHAAELSSRLLESEREATRVREGVLAGASTEILQPLSRLTSLIYRVRRDGGEARAAHLAEMEREVQQLRHNAGQFIDYSLIKAGQELSITPRPTDPLRIVRGAVAAWPSSARVRAELPEELPPVLADDGRVLQMLMSLISNAVKFSPPHAPVEVTARAGDEAVAISVSDHGPGIPEREIDRIFHELRRGSTAAGTEGAGLGLFLCRLIAEASGGELLVRTEVGSGSTFTIVVPRAREGR